MSAVKIMHSLFQSEISFQMRTQHQDGLAMTECAVLTRKGTKVADVAWASLERLLEIRDSIQAIVAPEICLEVLSASNTDQEMNEKRELYFERGALEFWICTETGDMRFFNRSGQFEKSSLFPDFPVKIQI